PVDLQVIYTAENETADQFIERFTAKNNKKYDITVATSDRLEQNIIWGNNCHRLSARELETMVYNCGLSS
ncbi:MAG: NYN domain-containing protein, partial [Lachnospiraceae bacterium]|nr:NYN domain-containing protein [Lachnospiraceae bacterium]